MMYTDSANDKTLKKYDNKTPNISTTPIELSVNETRKTTPGSQAYLFERLYKDGAKRRFQKKQLEVIKQ